MAKFKRWERKVQTYPLFQLPVLDADQEHEAAAKPPVKVEECPHCEGSGIASMETWCGSCQGTGTVKGGCR